MLTSYSIKNLEAAYPPSTLLLRAANDDSPNSLPKQISTPQPRRLHELVYKPEGEDRSADTLRFAGEAAREGWSPDEVRATLLDTTKPISAHCLGQDDPHRAADRAIEKAFSTLHQSSPVSIAASPYIWVPAEDIAPLDWLFGHWVLREEVSFVVAPGGLGKSTFLAGVALAMVTGSNILGKNVPNGPKRVWIWNLEDSVAMMRRTIQATAKVHGILVSDLGDRLFLDSARDGSQLCTATRTRDGLLLQGPVHDALVAVLRENKIDVLMVDPFVSSHEANENDNGEIDKVAKQWCRVAQEANCAIILCHHTSKAGSAEVNTMSARGAVAMTAAARVVLVLNPMTATEASRLGVDEDERWRLVRVTMDKSNRAPLEKADWFRKASVTLGPGDSAGAFERWSLPEATDWLTPETLLAIKAAFGEYGHRESPQSRDWAGYVIADAMGWDRPETSTPQRGKINRIIGDLLKLGHLIKTEERVERSKLVPMLRLAQPYSPPAQRGEETGEAVASS